MNTRLLALAAALMASVATLAPAQGMPPATGFTVSGEGVVDVAPDMAVVSLGVTTEGITAAAALKANNDEQARVLAALAAAGVDARDIQTTGLSLSPIWDSRSYDDGRPRVTGYQASNMVTVRVRDLDSLGTLLDTMVTTGANQLNSISFGLTDDKAAKDEARRRAVADAMARAQLYAQASGVTLGAVTAFSETNAYQPPQPMYREAAAMDSGVPVAAGAVAVTAAVSITFGIGQ
jgi:uncharacterized protein YggE